ncbi:MAG: serine/threonine protein kinase [Gammaproteobacteria bacterium]
MLDLVSRQESGLDLEMDPESVSSETYCGPVQGEYETTSRPQRVGKYQITEILGKGATGVVYKAIDPDILRIVALKTINATFLERSESKTLRARFRREAQAVGKLHHPNVVDVFAYGEEHEFPFIVMEYVEGRDLKSYLQEGKRFGLEEAVKIMGQVLDALTYCHSRGVIHRDLKPANIFLLEDGLAKIADFGIAHIDTSTLTQTGAVLGTPSYMSPEQFMGQAVDARADLYCAGMLLYELLTGENPYAGQSATAIMHKLLCSEPIEPTQRNINLPHAVDPLLRKALARKPAERFQTAEEFKYALTHATKGKFSLADAETTLPPIASVRDLILVPHARPRSKNRLWLLAAAVAIVSGGVVATRLYFQPVIPKGSPTSASPSLINVSSDPPEATILIDGQFVGFTPKGIAKPPGEYAIVLKKAGYQDLRAKLVVERSADLDFDVILEAGE